MTCSFKRLHGPLQMRKIQKRVMMKVHRFKKEFFSFLLCSSKRQSLFFIGKSKSIDIGLMSVSVSFHVSEYNFLHFACLITPTTPVRCPCKGFKKFLKRFAILLQTALGSALSKKLFIIPRVNPLNRTTHSVSSWKA